MKLLVGISACSTLLPVFVAFFRFSEYEPARRAVAMFVLVALGFDYGFVLLKNAQVLNSLPLAHVWVAASTALLGRVYAEAFADDRRLALGVRLGVGALLAFVVFNALPVPLADGLWRMPSQALTAQSLLFTVLALLYFYRLFTAEQPVAELEQNGLFWVNSGVLIYYAVNFFAFALWNRMIGEGQGQLSNVIHLATNLIVNTFYAYGLFCRANPSPN